MRFLTDKISQLKLGWNERPLTEADFYRVCKRFNIEAQEVPISIGGFYYRMMGRDFIAVDSRLSGPRKLAVLFHELGHFLFHTPETGPAANFHGVGRRTRREREADVFAVCAVIPRLWIERRSTRELVEDDGFPREMIAARQEIYEKYGI